MIVKWRKQAEQEVTKQVDYCLMEFGMKATKNFINSIDLKVEQMKKNPEIGFPEMLLSSKSRKYRSCIVGKHHKLVYWYSVSSDTIYISDLWDMRRDPDRLIKRI